MAKLFNYRFQNILKVKEILEDQRKHQVAQEQKQLFLEKERLKLLIKKRENNIEKWKEITKDSNIVKIKELQETAMYIDKINDFIDGQSDIVNQQKENVNIARTELVEAKKQTKIFKKLKEKDYERFLERQSKREMMLTDQIVTYNSSVNKGG